MTSTISDQVSLTSEQRQLIDRDFAIVEQFSRAMIDDEKLDDEVPNGAVLVLLPDDDPELTAASLQSALDFARLGKNIYIRHVYRVGDKVTDRGNPVYSPYPQGKASTNQ